MHTSHCFADRGTLVLTLCGLLKREEKLHDLVVEAGRDGGRWNMAWDGVAGTFNAPLHPVRGRVEELPGGGLRVDLDATIHPDPWVLGGAGSWSVDLRPGRDGGWTGTWKGVFTGHRLSPEEGSGTAQAFWREPYTVTGRVAGEARLLDEWRSRGPAGRLGDWRRSGETADADAGDMPQRVFDAREYGAEPDSGRDATAAIQSAIDAAIDAGGGLVQLPPGRLDLALDRADVCLELHGDRVHLRGAGSGPDGTLLYAHRPGRADDPRKLWRAGRFPRIAHVGPRPASLMEDEPDSAVGPVICSLIGGEERGATCLRLGAGGEILRPGLHLLEQHELADGSLGDALTWPSLRRAKNWRRVGRAIVRHYIRVLEVAGDVARLDHPLPFRIEARWQPHLRLPELVRGCAISDLRVATAWDGYFEHHKDDLHDNGWDGIRCDQVAGLRIQRVVFESVTTAASLKDAFACRIEDCRIAGNPGHNGFGVGGCSTRCLLKGIAFGRAMHACNLQGTISQNALVDCEADEPAGIDFHGSLGLDTLIDRLIGCVSTGGGSADNVPPRHGPGLVWWNWRCGTYNPYVPWHPLTVAADARETPGFILVGAHARRPLHVIDDQGRSHTGPIDAPWGLVEHLNTRVHPDSLHAWQRNPEAELTGDIQPPRGP
jgi:hypothetical protein